VGVALDWEQALLRISKNHSELEIGRNIFKFDFCILHAVKALCRFFRRQTKPVVLLNTLFSKVVVTPCVIGPVQHLLKLF